MVGSDMRSLFAVLKLDSHEKLRKETGECLVILSGIEARLGNRLKMYKSKSVTEVRQECEMWSLSISLGDRSDKLIMICLLTHKVPDSLTVLSSGGKETLSRVK